MIQEGTAQWITVKVKVYTIYYRQAWQHMQIHELTKREYIICSFICIGYNKLTSPVSYGRKGYQARALIILIIFHLYQLAFHPATAKNYQVPFPLVIFLTLL